MMTGHCLCGAVEVRVAEGHETSASVCHCSYCRRWTGSAFWGFAADGRLVSSSGPVKSYRSTPFSERAFCATCGTHLWIHDDDGSFDLLPGLFEDAREMPLDHEIYIDQAFACVRLAGDHLRRTKAEYEATNRVVEDRP